MKKSSQKIGAMFIVFAKVPGATFIPDYRVF